MNSVTLTQAAQDYLKKIIAKEEGVGFRLSIKKTGCSGYSYQPSVIKTAQPNDYHEQLDNGVDFYLDSAWLTVLSDVVIDYCEEDKNGLKQKRLVFTNSQEANRCGCGESFQIES